jgi:hypothetical protein
MSDGKSEKPDGQATLLAEGEAALWLSESLIFALLEAGVLGTEAILEAIEIVIAAKKAEKAEDSSRDPDISRAAAAQLAVISSSIAAARTAASPGQTSRRRRGGPKRPVQS